MTSPVFAFIYHLNLGHSELSGKHRQQMLEHDLAHLVNYRGRIPLNISSMGLDWKVINHVNPSAINAINTNPNITILDGMHSHLLPTVYPKLARLAQKYSKQTTDELFERVSPVGFAPEHDISSRNGHHLTWTAGVINKDIHSYYPWDKQRERIIPTTPEPIPYSAVRVKHQEGSIPCLVAEGGTIRGTYLRLMREHAEPQDFINGIKRALHRATIEGSPLVSFVMDWETPYINAIDGQPRLDLVDQLSQELSHADIPFATLDDTLTEQVIAYANDQPAITHRKHYTKWQPNPFRETVHNLTRKFIESTPYEQQTLLAAAASDHDSAQHGLSIAAEKPFNAIVQLPSKKNGKEGLVTIASDAHRAQEYKHIAANLAAYRPLNANSETLPVASQWYLDKLHASLHHILQKL